MSGKRMIQWTCDTCGKSKVVDSKYGDYDEPLPPSWVQVSWTEYQEEYLMRQLAVFCSIDCAGKYPRK